MSNGNLTEQNSTAPAANVAGNPAPNLVPVASPTGIPQLGWMSAGMFTAVGEPVPVVQAAPVSPPVVEPPAMENKDQLHRRVQARLFELEASQAQLAGQDGNKEHAQAIETELQVARDAMSGGWEHVGEMEAAKLSLWLTNTENLLLAKSAEPVVVAPVPLAAPVLSPA